VAEHEAKIGFAFQRTNMLRDLLIAFGDLLLIMVKRVQGLLVTSFNLVFPAWEDQVEARKSISQCRTA